MVITEQFFNFKPRFQILRIFAPRLRRSTSATVLSRIVIEIRSLKVDNVFEYESGVEFVNSQIFFNFEKEAIS